MTDLGAMPDSSRLPASAWVLAFSCLMGQLMALADRGFNQSDGTWVLLSIVVSALAVGWVSAGVLRARTGRLVLVWILFAAELIASVFSVIDGVSTPAAMAILGLAASLAQVVALALFCRSRYFQRQRSRPGQEAEPSIAGLVLVAIVVGALGGLTSNAHGNDPAQQLRVGL